MTQDLESRCRLLIAELGICRADEVMSVRPLAGGVASDIAAVTVPGRELCVKFARAKLDVAEDWFAPVHRSRAEYAWLAAAAKVVPENVPKLAGWSSGLNGFAMEYLTDADVVLWKTELLAGRGFGGAEMVAGVLGRIHAASTAGNFDRHPFANQDDFRALRIEPYLTFTATRHPALSRPILAMADALSHADRVLVHGDVSPKNILFRGSDPVLLDAECATMGDPAFDAAFCLNHLVLKAIHLNDPRLIGEARYFWQHYAARVTWEPPGALGGRVAALLPMLMLARVDGKSPVEYLTDTERATVRALSIALIERPQTAMPGLFTALSLPRRPEGDSQ